MASRSAIVHLAQPTTGGVAEVVLQLVEIAIADGEHVIVGCPGDGDLATRAQAMGATWIPLDLARNPGLADLMALRRIRKAMVDARVVFAHSSKTGALARMVRPRGVPLVFVPHGWSWLVGGRFARAYRIIERVLGRRADVTVLVGHDELAEGHRVLGPDARLRVIENSVDLERFHPPAEPRPGDDLTILCVGRLTRQKGQDLLLRAVARLGDIRPTVRLVGPGDAEDLAALSDLADRLGLEDHVHFVGSDDPVTHLQRADIVAIPSRWEGLPLVMLEAMACGAAIVASSTAGVDALADAGAVVPMGDRDDFVDDLAQTLRTLLESPEQRADLGQLARARAEHRYGRARMADEYRELWQ